LVIQTQLGLYRKDGGWRASKRAAPGRIEGLPESAAAEVPRPEDAETVRRVLEIIEGLPENERDVLSACSESDASFAEIGRGLGFSRARTWEIYNRGVRRVRATLGLRRDEVHGDENLLRVRIRAMHERLNGLIIQARLLNSVAADLDFKHFEGADAEASRAASRVVAAILPDIDRLEAASEILARLRLGSEDKTRRRARLRDDVAAVDLDIRALEKRT